MNNSKRLRKSSDEVRVELSDAEEPERRYWNIENERYDYGGHRDRTHTTTVVKDRRCGCGSCTKYRRCGCKTGKTCSCGKKPSKNQISIQFDLDETRQMTQDQKQTILNTLVSDGAGHEEGTARKFSYGRLLPESGLIPLIALLAFFAFFSLIIIAAVTGGHYHYYY